MLARHYGNTICQHIINKDNIFKEAIIIQRRKFNKDFLEEFKSVILALGMENIVGFQEKKNNETKYDRIMV